PSPPPPLQRPSPPPPLQRPSPPPPLQRPSPTPPLQRPPPSETPLQLSAQGAPPWLVEPLKILTRRNLGVHFRALMQTLIRLEERFGFDEPPPLRGLGKELRPLEVTTWINAGRGTRSKNVYDAGIRDVGDYGTRWRAWWDSLQPEWRKKDKHGARKVYSEYDEGMDWDTLASRGPNGTLSVVASLYFWGSACEGAAVASTPEDKQLWEAAVHDVTWMLEGVEWSLPVRKEKKKKASRKGVKG
ncbi:hypothetical protein C8R46DRAFT_897828, partial [Mycena filopes]